MKLFKVYIAASVVLVVGVATYAYLFFYEKSKYAELGALCSEIGPGMSRSQLEEIVISKNGKINFADEGFASVSMKKHGIFCGCKIWLESSYVISTGKPLCID